MRKRDIISMYSSGLCELALAALGVAVLCLVGLQIIAQLANHRLDADGILLFTWQSAVFMALWPGQTFYTIRRTTPCGREHAIIGIPSDDDLCLANRRNAQRHSRRLHD